MATIKQVNKLLAQQGKAERLIRHPTQKYYYFMGGTAEHWYESGLYGYGTSIKGATNEQIVAIRDERAAKVDAAIDGVSATPAAQVKVWIALVQQRREGLFQMTAHTDQVAAIDAADKFIKRHLGKRFEVFWTKISATVVAGTDGAGEVLSTIQLTEVK